jgi:SAM-dependent methyltransferase
MKGKRVLEIGLGYGTLGQKIAETGADYVGLDIARGPVRMMNHRLRMAGLGGVALQGSMLSCPLKAGSCDAVVSIGCFHHTGDIARCIRETSRVLKRGGRAFLMVYNQYSYRQWLRWPLATLGEGLAELGLRERGRTITEEQKKAYDSDTSGAGAPETVFLSIRLLREMLADFSEVRFFKENCTDFQLKGFTFIQRKKMLATLGRTLGLDIYLEAVK